MNRQTTVKLSIKNKGSASLFTDRVTTSVSVLTGVERPLTRSSPMLRSILPNDAQTSFQIHTGQTPLRKGNTDASTLLPRTMKFNSVDVNHLMAFGLSTWKHYQPHLTCTCLLRK